MTDNLTPRQREILDAATAVLANAGSRGLTHRAVDRQAGLPEGSTSAYFRSRGALLSALAELVASQLADDVTDLGVQLAQRPDDHGFAVSAVSRLVGDWLSRPELLTARLELALASTRDPGLATIMGAWHHQLTSVVSQIITRAGTPRAEVLGPTTVAALDGVLLVALQLPEADRADFSSNSVGALLDALTDPRIAALRSHETQTTGATRSTSRADG